MENTIEKTAPVAKVTTKKAVTRKPAAKKATPVAAKKTVQVAAKFDTTKAVNAVAEAANEVQETTMEIKNAVVKTVNDVNKKVTTSVNDMNKKVTATVKDVNDKVTSSVKKMNKEVMETASEISTTTTKLANEVVESLKVNERIANVKEVVTNPNKYALEATNNLIDNVETNTIKWQKTADKAFTTGLKLAVMQEELIFSSLEAVKTHVGTTAMRVKNLFGLE
ncbi:MAG: hypothetical protein NWQ46_08355, partial [Spirosomaceae bacterium]|nr:hypothetical protein [Spirosomataceae bacterium]